MRRAVIVTVGMVLAVASTSATDQWPSFRGPNAGVVADDAVLPDTWSPTENIVWKADIPGLSWSSPVVWDDHIIVTSAISAGQEATPEKGLYAKGATFRTPGARAHDAALQGRLAFVADGASGLQVVDPGTPSRPRIVGEFKTTMPARAVAAAKTLVLIAVGTVEEGPAGSAVADEGQVLILEHRQ